MLLPNKYTRRLLIMVDGKVVLSYGGLKVSEVQWRMSHLENHGFRHTTGLLTPDQFEVVLRWERGEPRNEISPRKLTPAEEEVTKHFRKLWNLGVKPEGFLHDELLLSAPDKTKWPEVSAVLSAIYSQLPPTQEEPKPEEKPPVELNKEFWDAYTGMDTKDFLKDNLRQNAKTFSFSTGIETGRTDSRKSNPSNPLRQGQDEEE